MANFIVMPIMPKFFNQLNHGESKFNSELHIRNWKKSGMESKHLGNFAILQPLQNFAGLGNFAFPAKFCSPYEISQGCKFSQPANLLLHTIDLLTFFLLHFSFFLNCPSCNSDSFILFCNFVWLWVVFKSQAAL